MSFTLVIGNKSYSSWSLRPWILMKAFEIPFDEVVLDLGSPEFARHAAVFTPAGKVPVLEDGTVAVWESLAILDHIADRFPEHAIWPRAAAPRALARSIAAEMHAGFVGLRQHYPFNVRRKIEGRAPNDAALKDIDRVRMIWRDARDRFGAQGPFLFGAFTAADAMYAPVVARFETYGIEAGPIERAYMSALTSMPAYRSWVQDALLEMPVAKYER